MQATVVIVKTKRKRLVAKLFTQTGGPTLISDRFLASLLIFQTNNKFPIASQRLRIINTRIVQWSEEFKFSNSSCILSKAGMSEFVLKESKR